MGNERPVSRSSWCRRYRSRLFRGQNDNPTYKKHPGHAEGIEITYDPNETSYEELLDYFFRVHDPTTVDRQGNDRGASYRSAIFIQDEKESEIAKTVIKIVDDSGRWSGKVVTTLGALH